MIVLDASVWVSWFLPNDTNHAATVPWMRATLIAATPIVLPSLCPVEVGGALARRADDVLARHAVQLILGYPALRIVSVDDTVMHAATDIAIAVRLRGADAVYVAVAEALRLPLISWDMEHTTRAISRIPVFTPDGAPLPAPPADDEEAGQP